MPHSDVRCSFDTVGCKLVKMLLQKSTKVSCCLCGQQLTQVNLENVYVGWRVRHWMLFVRKLHYLPLFINLVVLCCVCRSSGCMASICGQRASVRRSSTRRSICCFWLEDFVTARRKHWRWLLVWALNHHKATSRTDDSVHCRSSAVLRESSLPSRGSCCFTLRLISKDCQ